MMALDPTTAPTLTNQTQVDALIWERVPHPSWQEELDRITPPDRAENKARSVIWWEPGDEWEPIQRWIVYQMVPLKAVPPEIIRQLNGPHPRSAGEYSKKLGCWKNGPAPLITKTAWVLHQKFKGWAKPYWIVQGDNGGHRYDLFPWERVLLHLQTGKRDLPLAGDLPYAEPDQRTYDALRFAQRRHDETMKIALMATKYRGKLDGEDAAMVEKVARQYVAAWGEKIATNADELAWAMKRNTSLARTDAPDSDYVEDEEELVHELMHEWTGNVPKLNF